MAVVKTKADVIDPVLVCRDGRWEEMSLADAVELDNPEGAAVIHVSATLLAMLVSR